MYFFRRISDSNRSTHSNVGLFDSLQQLISGQTKTPVYLTHTLDDFAFSFSNLLKFSVLLIRSSNNAPILKPKTISCTFYD